MFVKSLLGMDEKKFKKLPSYYRAFKQELSSMTNSEIGDRQSHYFAVILLAHSLAFDVLGIGGIKETQESIKDLFVKLVEEGSGAKDTATEAMEYVLSWANGNEKAFKGEAIESFGIWREGEYIGILPHKLHDILEKKGFSDRAVLKVWSDRGWIERKDKRHMACLKKDRGDVKRVIVIPWTVFKKFNFINENKQ